MGKYRRESSQSLTPSKNSQPMHAIWRGVGFGMMILIPVMSYALARLFLDENFIKGWITFPKNMYLENTPLPSDLLILILIMIVFMLVMYAIFTFFSLIIFRLFAPPSYGPLDVPPITYHGKNYNR
jgi:hypothetical protein